MKESDELDLSLLNALQIAPRAPWKVIAEVVGTSPITAARRWDRLATAGLAWATVCGSSRLMQQTSLAVVAVNCGSRHIEQAGRALLDDPYTVTVSHTAGDCDLLVIVWTPDLATLSRYVVDRLNTLPGTCAVHISPASEVYTDGSRWRLRALDADRQRQLQAAAPVPDVPSMFRAEDRQLMIALSHDARASYKELSALTGTSQTTVQRRMRRLLGEGGYTARCEVSHRISGSPIEVTMWLEAPSAAVATAGRRLAQLAQARLCVAVVGSSNLVLVAWLRSIGDLQELEIEVTRRAPMARIVKRALTLRHLKLITRILDNELAGRVVPADIWRYTLSLSG